MRVLMVVNKQVPENDYRVQYQAFAQACQLTYAMPGKPQAVPPERFVPFGFGESIKAADLSHYRRLYLYLRQNRHSFDLAHFYSTSLILFGPVLAGLAGVASVITLTGFGRTFNNHSLKYRLLRPLYRLLLGNATRISRAVLLQNCGDLAILQGWFPKEAGKFHYMGSAVASPVVPRKDFHSARLRVLLVARLLPDKGVEDFLRAAELLQGNIFDFILVGPPSIGFESLLEKVQDCHRQGLVQYQGELDTQATQAQFERAQVLFFPSYGEGMSRVMLEAGFAQLCPVAYDIPANRDLVEKGRGFLVPVGQVEEAVAVLEAMAANRDLLAGHARAYQEFIVENYGMEKYAQAMDRLLETLFPGGSSQSSEESEAVKGQFISQVQPDDLEHVVAVHMESFQNFFLSQLGPGFLRVLYGSILEDGSGIALKHENQAGLDGFVFGTSEPQGFYRRLLQRRWPQFAAASLPALLRDPRILPRLLRALHNPHQFQAKANSALLMSVAVSQQAQGRGIGRQLVQAFLDEAFQRGLAAVTLTTDAANNEAVNAFYQGLGFYLSRTFKTPEGRLMNAYVHDRPGE
jgi:glycosyltransferase involved in cell wall biosynthesis/ribosomal protein S18 acetylase RimI-like enzyme